MRSQHFARILGLLVALSGVAAASGQVITGRSTGLSYNYVFGGGGDSNVGGDSVFESTIDPSDSDHLEFSGCTSGALPNGEEYTACAASELDYAFSITGSPSDFRTLNASATNHVTATSTGAGVSVMYASNPGTEVTMSFTVPAPARYQLSGSIMHPDPSAFSYVALQRFDGFTWQIVFTTIFMPGGSGTFDRTDAMPAGDYRIQGILGLRAFGNEDVIANFDYSLIITRPGDMNCDLLVDGDDIHGFVQAVLQPDGYLADFPDCNIRNADINADRQVDTSDVGPFIQCMLNGGC